MTQTADGSTTVTDQQIRVLVAGARALAERHRAQDGDGNGAAALDRLARLDWAVSAGGRALADRADRAGTSSTGRE